MPKDYRKEISFQAGELSPLFYGRSETEFYVKGLAVAKNVRIDKRGGAFRRCGARNRGQIAGNEARVFTKQVHENRFDTILVYDSEMLIVSPGIDFASANLLANGKFATGSTGWTVVALTTASRAIFANNVCRLKPQQNNGSQTVSIRKQATVTASITDSHTVRVQQAETRLLRIKVGTTAGGVDIADEYSNEELIEFSFIPNNATYYVEVESDGDTSLGSTLVHVATLATADIGGLGKTYSTPWTEDQLGDIHIAENPTGEAVYMLHPNVAPYKLVYDYATDAYTAPAAVVFTAPPAEWTGTNYPATGTYFEGRLWLAATPNEPQTVWSSKSANPEDFTTGAGAADSWNLTLQQQGRIKWMSGTKDLVLGAENAEHVVTSDGGVITQLDFKVERQSAYGSNNMQSIQAGEKVFYLTPDGRKVQSMAYEWQENNWLSQDLTFASEDITAGVARRRVWAQNPDSLYSLVLENGNVATLTYDRTSQTIGWSDMQYDGQVVLDMAVGQIAGTSRHVYAVQRVADEIELEIEISEKVYMDSFSQAYHNIASNTVNGLDHLEGEEVRVVVDGAVDPVQTVSSGSIITTSSGKVIYAGKQISSIVKTLPPDAPDSQIRSWLKRWNKIWALVWASAPPIINGTRPPDRSPSTPMGTPEPLTTGHFKAVTLGWDRNGQITIEENLPVPMNILALYGELSRESLQ